MPAAALVPEPANSCVLTGRLLLIRADAGYRRVEQVAEMEEQVTRALLSLPAGDQCVVAADWRRVQVMSPEATAAVHAMMFKVRARIVRSAILTFKETATANLQANRLMKGMQHADERRGFAEPSAMCAWLAEKLSAADACSLRRFLDLPESGAF